MTASSRASKINLTGKATFQTKMRLITVKMGISAISVIKIKVTQILFGKQDTIWAAPHECVIIRPILLLI